MSYQVSPYAGRRAPNRYRGESPRRSRERAYEDSASRKRYRSGAVLGHPNAPSGEMSRKNYDVYSPNCHYNGSSFTDDGRRSRPTEQKYRSSSRYGRDMDYNSMSKRGRTSGRPMDQVPPKPSRILGAFGLAPRTEERHLYNIMKKYGDIEQVKILRDNVSTRSRGFGFVYFETMDGARAARSACARGLELHGKMVRIDYSYTKGPYTPTPGMYLGREKRQTSHTDTGRRSGYENRRHSPDFFVDHPPRSHSPQPPRHRRAGSTDQYYHKSRAIEHTSRSRSPLQYNGEHSRNRISKEVRSFRQRPSRGDMRDIGYDLPRSSKNELVTLDRTPPSH